MDQGKLDKQSQYWERNFLNKPEMFGLTPSVSAIKALKVFKENKITKILELGSGLGRDTVFFAKNSIKVVALDYSPCAVKVINNKAKQLKLEKFITANVFDVRKKLNFNDEIFEGCYSHMLYCMALINRDIIKLNNEICRVIKSKGINIYTVRNIEDGDFKNGVYEGEDLYCNDGFIVHFFSKNKINSLLKGFKNINIECFEEGNFPRKLFIVSNKKI